MVYELEWQLYNCDDEGCDERETLEDKLNTGILFSLDAETACQLQLVYVIKHISFHLSKSY